MILTERIYEASHQQNTYAVFVDRLWPRGLAKKDVFWEEWLREISPTPALRKWFSHDPKKWDEFKLRYWHELEQKHEEIKRIKQLEKKYNIIVLLYAARDEIHNHAVVLKEFLEKTGNTNKL
ncbi:MAG TPA: DUF488 family protein [Draconibacterium sp.]|nr:DUF488 family protein [Draconibacterium sp.]